MFYYGNELYLFSVPPPPPSCTGMPLREGKGVRCTKTKACNAKNRQSRGNQIPTKVDNRGIIHHPYVISLNPNQHGIDLCVSVSVSVLPTLMDISIFGLCDGVRHMLSMNQVPSHAVRAYSYKISNTLC